MKLRYFIYIASLCAAALISCNKENETNQNRSNEILITFEAGELSFGQEESETKITHSQSETTHSFAWENGDQISMIFFNAAGGSSVSSATHVANTSTRRFTLTEGSSGTFTGSINMDDLNALTVKDGDSNKMLNSFIIYPGTDLTVSSVSSADGTSLYYYTVDGASLAATQDGTGWPYCYFTTVTPKFNRNYKVFASGAKSLGLSHTMAKFNIINSAKDITNIKIETTGSYLVGDITYWIGHSQAQAVSSTDGVGRMKVQRGGTDKVLNINNGGVLPSEILFACRGIPKGTLTFTFTASDNTKTTKSATVSAGNQNLKILDMGSVNLSGAVWE